MLLKVTSSLSKKVKRGQGGRQVWIPQMHSLVRWHRNRLGKTDCVGPPSLMQKKAASEAGSQIPEKGVMIVSVEKQNVPDVEHLNPVIHNW